MAWLDVTKAWRSIPQTVVTGAEALRQPGHFLAEQFGQFDLHVAEDTSEDVRAMARSAGEWMNDFLGAKVDVPGHGLLTRDQAIEWNAEGDHRHARAVIEGMAGDIGLLALNFPEEHGGMSIPLTDKSAISMAVAANGTASAVIGVGGHTGIGLGPIVNFGTAAQKAKYLPPMLRGERISSFALTEPGAGTDLDAIRTTATLIDLPEGGKGWRIDGNKMWITNAGLSVDSDKPGQFIVFARFDKVDGPHTAFIVDGETPGITVHEEHKLGLRGSSTCAVHFDVIVVPEDALLGKVGQGKTIALNTLGKGRLGIPVGNVGMLHRVVHELVDYAKGRPSMGNPIADYGTLERKISWVAIVAFELETMGFGAAALFESWLQHERGSGKDVTDADGWNALALETSVLKVLGSEDSYRMLIEAAKGWGGYGFSEEYPMARLIRDHWVDMIFEGENDAAQRLGTIVKSLFKRSFAGKIPPLVSTDETWQAREAYLAERFAGHPLLQAMRLAEASKETVNLAAMALMTMPNMAKVMQDHSLGQHLGMELADLVIAALANHYVVARALKLTEHFGAEAAATAINLAMASVYQRHETVRNTARRLFDEIYGDRPTEYDEAFQRLNRLDLNPRTKLLSLRAKIAQTMKAHGGYRVI